MPAPELQRRTIQVDGAERVYWLAPAAEPNAPLLMALHGSGINAHVMAEWTGLATQGPAAGFTTVFPDARQEMWDDTGLGRADRLDDTKFIGALIDALQAGHQPRPKVALLGLSNGATFAELLARRAAVAVDQLVLVAGTARVASRRITPIPRQPADVLIIIGTDDQQLPYEGGRGRGFLAWYARRRARRVIPNVGGREVVAAEKLAADWAAVNGCSPDPTIEHLDGQSADKLTWSAPGGRGVTLYRLIGAGHGWPGFRQYLPAWLIGKIPQDFDATAVALEFAAQSGRRQAVD